MVKIIIHPCYETPMLKGPTVGLVPLQTTDELVMFRWMNDPAIRVAAGRPNWKACYSLEQVQDLIKEWLGQSTRFDLMVVDLEKGEPCGLIELNHLHAMSDSARLSLVWGGRKEGGLAKEALTLASNYAFETQALHRLWTRVPCDSDFIMSAFHNIGFRAEGVLREDHFNAGVWHDSVLLSLLATEARKC